MEERLIAASRKSVGICGHGIVSGAETQMAEDSREMVVVTKEPDILVLLGMGSMAQPCVPRAVTSMGKWMPTACVLATAARGYDCVMQATPLADTYGGGWRHPV